LARREIAALLKPNHYVPVNLPLEDPLIRGLAVRYPYFVYRHVRTGMDVVDVHALALLVQSTPAFGMWKIDDGSRVKATYEAIMLPLAREAGELAVSQETGKHRIVIDSSTELAGLAFEIIGHGVYVVHGELKERSQYGMLGQEPVLARNALFAITEKVEGKVNAPPLDYREALGSYEGSAPNYPAGPLVEFMRLRLLGSRPDNDGYKVLLAAMKQANHYTGEKGKRSYSAADLQTAGLRVWRELCHDRVMWDAISDALPVSEVTVAAFDNKFRAPTRTNRPISHVGLALLVCVCVVMLFNTAVAEGVPERPIGPPSYGQWLADRATSSRARFQKKLDRIIAEEKRWKDYEGFFNEQKEKGFEDEKWWFGVIGATHWFAFMVGQGLAKRYPRYIGEFWPAMYTLVALAYMFYYFRASETLDNPGGPNDHVKLMSYAPTAHIIMPFVLTIPAWLLLKATVLLLTAGVLAVVFTLQAIGFVVAIFLALPVVAADPGTQDVAFDWLIVVVPIICCGLLAIGTWSSYQKVLLCYVAVAPPLEFALDLSPYLVASSVVCAMVLARLAVPTPVRARGRVAVTRLRPIRCTLPEVKHTSKFTQHPLEKEPHPGLAVIGPLIAGAVPTMYDEHITSYQGAAIRCTRSYMDPESVSEHIDTISQELEDASKELWGHEVIEPQYMYTQEEWFSNCNSSKNRKNRMRREMEWEEECITPYPEAVRKCKESSFMFKVEATVITENFVSNVDGLRSTSKLPRAVIISSPYKNISCGALCMTLSKHFKRTRNGITSKWFYLPGRTECELWDCGFTARCWAAHSVWSLDFSKFDGAQHDTLQLITLVIVQHLLGNGANCDPEIYAHLKRGLDLLRDSRNFNFKLKNKHGQTLISGYCSHSRQTGGPETTTLNSLMAALMFKTTWNVCCRKYGWRQLDLDLYATAGDDTLALLNLSPHEAQERLPLFAAEMKLIGGTITGRASAGRYSEVLSSMLMPCLRHGVPSQTWVPLPGRQIAKLCVTTCKDPTLVVDRARMKLASARSQLYLVPYIRHYVDRLCQHYDVGRHTFFTVEPWKVHLAKEEGVLSYDHEAAMDQLLGYYPALTMRSFDEHTYAWGGLGGADMSVNRGMIADVNLQIMIAQDLDLKFTVHMGFDDVKSHED
jgi:hypothetical protein